MVRSCAVCGYREIKDSKISLHKIPLNSKTWVDIIIKFKPEFSPTKSSLICSQHFKATDYYNEDNFKKPKLLPNSSPSIFWNNVGKISRKRKKPDLSNTSGELPNNFTTAINESKTSNMSKTGDLSNGEDDGEKNNSNLGIKSGKLIKKLRVNKEGMISNLKLKLRRERLKNKLLWSSLVKAKNRKRDLEKEHSKCLKIKNNLLKEIVERSNKNIEKRERGDPGISSSSFSEELEGFSLGCHFYSPKCYELLRKSLDYSLPSISYINKLYSKVDGTPGIKKECLEILKNKLIKSSSKLCTLMWDEISIHKLVSWDGNKFNGYSNLGNEFIPIHNQVATEALVFMVVSLTDDFKIPIAYFFTAGLKTETKIDIYKKIFFELIEIGVDLRVNVCDGPPSNVRFFNELGASFHDNQEISPFINLSKVVPDINKLDNKCIGAHLDYIHMFKLLRNALAEVGPFYSKGDEINWHYIIKLYEYEHKMGVKLTKLSSNHIHFHNMKMRVSLMAQVFSKSVADALKYLKKSKVHGFEDCGPTIFFISTMNKLFDYFNTSNKSKLSINKETKTEFLSFTSMAYEYIVNLEDKNGNKLYKNAFKRSTCIKGLLGGITLIKKLYYTLVETGEIKNLYFYKISQDHIEMLFGQIRSHLGSNDNPSPIEFSAIFKRIIVNQSMKSFAILGNCAPQDETQSLTIRSLMNNKLSLPEFPLHDDLNNNPLQDPPSDHDYSLSTNNINSYENEFIKENIVEIVGLSLKKIKCESCKNIIRNDANYQSISQICRETEKKINIIKLKNSFSSTNKRKVSLSVIDSLKKDNFS